MTNEANATVTVKILDLPEVQKRLTSASKWLARLSIERDRLRAALSEIAAEDWRGNKPRHITIAENALLPQEERPA